MKSKLLVFFTVFMVLVTIVTICLFLYQKEFYTITFENDNKVNDREERMVWKNISEDITIKYISPTELKNLVNDSYFRAYEYGNFFESEQPGIPRNEYIAPSFPEKMPDIFMKNKSPYIFMFPWKKNHDARSLHALFVFSELKNSEIYWLIEFNKL